MERGTQCQLPQELHRAAEVFRSEDLGIHPKASCILAETFHMSLLSPPSSHGLSDVTAVFEISWYHTGIWPFLDSFGTGMVCGMRKWYAYF